MSFTDINGKFFSLLPNLRLSDDKDKSILEDIFNGSVENVNIFFKGIIFEDVGEFSDDIKHFGKWLVKVNEGIEESLQDEDLKLKSNLSEFISAIMIKLDHLMLIVFIKFVFVNFFR
jgi:hypothetical protein